MSKSIQQNASDAGQSIASGVKKLSDDVVQGAKKAMQSMSEAVTGEGQDRGVAGITDHMQVIASCGKVVGSVDHLEGNVIKLTRKDSPDGLHHYIPTTWVDHVDSHVHLNRNSVETELNWKSSAADCQC